MKNYQYISLMKGSLPSGSSSTDMLGQVTQLSSGEKCPQCCFPRSTLTCRFLIQDHLLMKTDQFTDPGVAKLQADFTLTDEDAKLRASLIRPLMSFPV